MAREDADQQQNQRSADLLVTPKRDRRRKQECRAEDNSDHRRPAGQTTYFLFGVHIKVISL